MYWNDWALVWHMRTETNRKVTDIKKHHQQKNTEFLFCGVDCQKNDDAKVDYAKSYDTPEVEADVSAKR